MRVSRSDPGGRAYLDLQQKARESHRPVQELFQLYVLEAFLDRLAQSDLRDDLVLKGGVLLAAFGERRPTRDIDLQAQAMSNEADDVLVRLVDIARIELDDGVELVTDDAKAAVIRDEEAYTGVRVSMRAQLATARLDLHVDVNVGDPINPAPEVVEIPRLLGGSISVRGYPLEMVLAEKIVTAVARGTVNTRWRDFMDVVGLASHHEIGGDELTESIRDVTEHRGVDLESLNTVLDGFGGIGQTKWAAWRRKQQVEDRTPESFEVLIAAFVAFAEPAVVGDAGGRRWEPLERAWR